MEFTSDPSIDLFPEYAGADLGDARRDRRLFMVAAATARDPSASFRQSAGSDAALEGTYRLLNNPEVQAEDIFHPHREQTVHRAREAGEVLVVHDTTELTFGGEKRKELGRMKKKGGKQGFLLHTSLVVGQDAANTPLGVLHFEPVVRPDSPVRKKSHKAYREDPCHEGRRWCEGVVQTDARLRSAATRAVHVMDREGDSYDVLSSVLALETDCVLRMGTDRATTELANDSGARVKVREVLSGKPFTCERQVSLSRRAEPLLSSAHTARPARVARLAMRGSSVELARPASADTRAPKSLVLQAVQVCELDAPADCEPVEWVLLTTLPVETEADLLRIVDIYRARWLIEEYFKALKTGCGIERRQNEHFDVLLNVVALMLPIAWRLLALRALAERDSDAPATSALTKTQLQALRALANKPLPNPATVEDAMWAIASLGGHHHRRKRPGWQVLGRGLEKLLAAEQVWIAARAAPAEM